MDHSEVINILKQAFPVHQTSLRGSAEFDDLNGSYLSTIESEITPAAIFRPKVKEDISTFFKLIKPYTQHGDLKLAIRGGGQQPTHGCANIENGITLDLSLLLGIDIKEQSVSIAAGERWGAVYDKLLPLGLGVSGSRSGKGGIGGLCLSASGDIVNANAQENSDLFIALRGGGNNFGVVTRYDLRTFKQGPFWGGSVYYFTPSFPSQIEALVSELNRPDATVETHLMISIGYAAQFGQTMCQNQLYYTQEVEKPAILEPFTAIQPQVDQLYSMRMLNLKDAATEQAGVAMDQQRTAYMNTVVRADAVTLKAAADIYTTALEPIKSVNGLVCSLTLQPYTVSLLKKSAESGGNSLGLDPSKGPLVSVLLLSYWKEKSDDEKVLAFMKDTVQKIKVDAKAKNQSVDYEYMNYAASFQDPIGSYGAENKKKLQDVSRKYDPEGFFQKAVPGGFKLFS
ncbi:FAD-binding domain-containing protein [Periconia macrospinosa]|uniref:FAD-binding domain-containing protein n=1 Tax=Periconia macrospinosa TaxID=97972 RepID=A0A2V1DRK5_9PLEO|nr:FAD-binding domain-containing protein [Periconia macrospinosa]